MYCFDFLNNNREAKQWKRKCQNVQPPVSLSPVGPPSSLLCESGAPGVPGTATVRFIPATLLLGERGVRILAETRISQASVKTKERGTKR